MNTQRFLIAFDTAAVSSSRRSLALRFGFIQLAFFAALLPTLQGNAAVLYVNASNAAPAAPYTNWYSAATTIQDAVDSASAGDVVLVTNGVYAVGGTKAFSSSLTNRVTVDKAVTLQSVNGPRETAIRGGGMTNGVAAIRCMWLTNGAALVGFTLEAGATLSSGNTADRSGGGVFCNASTVTVANCTIQSNTATANGAAAYQGSLHNCYIVGNVAATTVGVIVNSDLLNCSVVHNSGIGARSVNAVNSIVYFNPSTFGNPSGSFAYCCVMPTKPPGPGNITNNPAFLSDGLHLSTNSPCLGAGTNAATGVDIDGLAWNSPPAIGCDDWQTNLVILGAPAFQFNTAKRQLVFDLPIKSDSPFVCSWTKDGMPIVNDSAHADATTLSLKVDSSFPEISGSYQAVVSNASGIATSPTTQILIRYVDAAATNPVAPYTNWATAATMIQDAVDSALPGDIVLVTNGVYTSGGKPYNGGVTNRVLVTQPRVTIASVNGHAATIIQGAKDPNATSGRGPLAARCCFLATNGVSLSGFTLRGGSTANDPGQTALNNLGGGAASLGLPWSFSIPYSSNQTDARVVNCLISSNSALYGGGAVYLNLVNCVLSDNVAGYEGGGTYNCYLTNCTVSENFALAFGGGTSNGNLYNCVSHNNPSSIANGSNSWAPYVILYTCTTPAPTNGPNTKPPFTGDIVADPQFMDSAFHLAAASPARGTGSSLYSSGWDMEGRTWQNPPSMGANEVDDAGFIGALAVTIAAPQTNSFVGRTWNFTGLITGRASGLAWDWGDGTISTNVSFIASHVWTNVGDYTLTFTAFNSDNPGGVSANLQIHVLPLNPPLIDLPMVTSSGFACQFIGQSNANYTLQQTTNLVPPVIWLNIQTVTAGAGLVQFTNVSGTNLMEFYRVQAR